MSGEEGHVWHIKPSAALTPEWLADPKFCADALRKMVAVCEALHASGGSFYTDGERKVMKAAADHIDKLMNRTAN